MYRIFMYTLAIVLFSVLSTAAIHQIHIHIMLSSPTSEVWSAWVLFGFGYVFIVGFTSMAMLFLLVVILIIIQGELESKQQLKKDRQ